MKGRHVLAVVSVLLVAACLRPAITGVGPLLGEIGADFAMSALVLGLLGAVPLLAFAVFSPLAGSVARGWGIEAALLASLVVLVLGTLLRSVGGATGLWLGTAVLGGAVAIGNVLTPALVKRDFRKPAIATAAFAATLSGFAAVGSGVAVPLSDALGGWAAALAVTAVLPALGVLVWVVRMRLVRTPADAAPHQLDRSAVRAVWRSPVAWRVTLFFGLQSATFYITVTWLPTIEHVLGVSPTAAGLHLLVYQVVGSAAGFAIGFLMEGRTDQRLAAASVSVPVIVAMLGMVAAPQLVLLWVVLAAAGAGSALTVALTLVVLRSDSAAQTAALSGMAQSVGYLIAALGPVGAGAVAEHLGWNAVLVAVALIATTQTFLSLRVGRPETI